MAESRHEIATSPCHLGRPMPRHRLPYVIDPWTVEEIDEPPVVFILGRTNLEPLDEPSDQRHWASRRFSQGPTIAGISLRIT